MAQHDCFETIVDRLDTNELQGGVVGIIALAIFTLVNMHLPSTLYTNFNFLCVLLSTHISTHIYYLPISTPCQVSCMAYAIYHRCIKMKAATDPEEIISS